MEPLQTFWAKQEDPTVIVAMLVGYVRGEGAGGMERGSNTPYTF